MTSNSITEKRIDAENETAANDKRTENTLSKARFREMILRKTWELTIQGVKKSLTWTSVLLELCSNDSSDSVS